MRTILYALFVIKKNITTYAGMISLLMTIEITTYIALLFCYGAYCNYVYEQSDDVTHSRSISVDFFDNELGDSSVITPKDLVNIQDEIEKIFGIYLDSWGIYTEENNIQVIGVKEINKSEYEYTDLTARNLVEKGRYFSETEEVSAEKVCLTYWNDMRDLVYYGEKYTAIGAMLNWFDIDYEIVAESRDVYYVPFYSLPNNALVYCIEIHTNRRIANSMIDELEELLFENIEGGFSINKPLNTSENEQEMSKGMIVLTCIMTILASINIYLIFEYIFEKKKKSYAIARMVGGTSGKIFASIMIECLIPTIMATITGAILYGCILETILSRYFKYFNDIYTLKIYINATLGYILFLFVATLILSIKIMITTPVKLWRD